MTRSVIAALLLSGFRLSGQEPDPYAGGPAKPETIDAASPCNVFKQRRQDYFIRVSLDHPSVAPCIADMKSRYPALWAYLKRYVLSANDEQWVFGPTPPDAALKAVRPDEIGECVNGHFPSFEAFHLAWNNYLEGEELIIRAESDPAPVTLDKVDRLLALYKNNYRLAQKADELYTSGDPYDCKLGLLKSLVRMRDKIDEYEPMATAYRRATGTGSPLVPPLDFVYTKPTPDPATKENAPAGRDTPSHSPGRNPLVPSLDDMDTGSTPETKSRSNGGSLFDRARESVRTTIQGIKTIVTRVVFGAVLLLVSGIVLSLFGKMSLLSGVAASLKSAMAKDDESAAPAPEAQSAQSTQPPPPAAEKTASQSAPPPVDEDGTWEIFDKLFHPAHGSFDDAELRVHVSQAVKPARAIGINAEDALWNLKGRGDFSDDEHTALFQQLISALDQAMGTGKAGSKQQQAPKPKTEGAASTGRGKRPRKPKSAPSGAAAGSTIETLFFRRYHSEHGSYSNVDLRVRFFNCVSSATDTGDEIYVVILNALDTGEFTPLERRELFTDFMLVLSGQQAALKVVGVIKLRSFMVEPCTKVS